MRVDRVEMKAAAKRAMRGRRPSTYLVSLAMLVIDYVLSTLALRLQFPGLVTDDLMRVPVTTEAELQQLYTTLLRRMLDSMQNRSWVSWALSVAIAVLALMLTIGFTVYALRVARGQEAGFGFLFDGFGNFFRFLLLRLLTVLFTFLWSLPAVAGYVLMLLSVMRLDPSSPVLMFASPVLVFASPVLLSLGVVLGLLAAYRYSMAVYVLIDEPEKSALQCIRDSKAMTRGHKWELFVLDLTLIGWRLLSRLPFVSIYTLPYIETTKANFYRALSGRFDPPPDA